MMPNRFAQAAHVVLIALVISALLDGQPAQATSDRPYGGPALTADGGEKIVSYPYERYLVAPNGRAVYYQVFPGLAEKPVYLTVNGLLFKQEYWDTFLHKLNDTGATVIRYAFSADPESLGGKSASPREDFTVSGIVGEIEAILNAEGLASVTLLPLSYGSVSMEFAATHPNRVNRVVLMAPMILPMDAYNASGSTTRAYLESVRSIWGEAAYEVQWSIMMEPTVRSLVSSRVSEMEGYVVEGVSRSQVIDGAMQKIKTTRHFDLRNYLEKPLPRIDVLLTEGEDDSIFKDQIDFWEKLSPANRGSFVLMRDVTHAAPAEAPEATVVALEAIVANDGSTEKPFSKLEVSKDGKLLKQEPLN